jgi:hypothetical protein
MASPKSKDIIGFLEIKEEKHIVTVMVIGYPNVKCLGSRRNRENI